MGFLSEKLSGALFSERVASQALPDRCAWGTPVGGSLSEYSHCGVGLDRAWGDVGSGAGDSRMGGVSARVSGRVGVLPRGAVLALVHSVSVARDSHRAGGRVAGVGYVFGAVLGGVGVDDYESANFKLQTPNFEGWRGKK